MNFRYFENTKYSSLDAPLEYSKEYFYASVHSVWISVKCEFTTKTTKSVLRTRFSHFLLPQFIFEETWKWNRSMEKYQSVYWWNKSSSIFRLSCLCYVCAMCVPRLNVIFFCRLLMYKKYARKYWNQYLRVCSSRGFKT